MKKKMSKQEKRKLIWEYFIKQKLTEIVAVVIILLIFILLPFVVGKIVLGEGSSEWCAGDWGDVEVCSNLDFWGIGFGIILGGGFILYLLSIWIKSNWKKAEKKVKSLEVRV